MPTLEPIASYLLEFRREGRAAFLKAHSSPFLLVRMPEVAETSENSWTGFNTDTFRIQRGPAIGNWSDEELDAAAKAENVRVLEISKSADSPWRGRISIGRARNNDLVVNSAGVSKLHAHFTIEDDGVTRVTDAGSHNGTAVNDTKLGQGDNAALQAQDKLTFGDIQAVFHTPASFCDFLASLFESS